MCYFSRFQPPNILTKKPDVIILHVGTNDSVTRTSRKILDDLLQLKSVITKTLRNCAVILSQSTLPVDNGKAVLTRHYPKFLHYLDSITIFSILLVFETKTDDTFPVAPFCVEGYCTQKQPPRGVPKKTCFENMQQIYRRTPVPKCDLI